MFIDPIYSLLSYAQVMENDYAVRFVCMHVIDIIDDNMSSNFFAANSIDTYVRNVRAYREPVQLEDVSLMLRNIGKDELAANPLCITHHDVSNCYNPF